jgi:multidrug resistance efflux pump
MTDLERNFEKATTRLALLEEEKEAADGQLAELGAQVASLTAELAAASDEAAMYQQDLVASNVRGAAGLCWHE